MKTFVLAATAVGILTSALAAPATAQPNATGGTIKSQPAVPMGQAKTSKPASKKLEYFKIDLKDVQVS